MNGSLAKRGQLVLGLVVLAIGVGILASRLTGFEFDFWRGLWPLVIVAFGLVRFLDAQIPKRRREGLTILLVGLWLLINTLGLFGLGFRDSWPVLLVLLGLGRVVLPAEESRAGGFFLILIGVWLQISVLGLFGLDFEDSWPLAIIFGGIYIIVRAFEAERGRDKKEVRSDDRL